jgi:hypothetical protein
MIYPPESFPDVKFANYFPLLVFPTGCYLSNNCSQLVIPGVSCLQLSCRINRISNQLVLALISGFNTLKKTLTETQQGATHA